VGVEVDERFWRIQSIAAWAGEETEQLCCTMIHEWTGSGDEWSRETDAHDGTVLPTVPAASRSVRGNTSI